MANEASKIKKHMEMFKRELPKMTEIMLTTAVNHFSDNFQKQGFDDNGVQKWQARKRNSYRTRSGKVVDDTSRGILIGKGSGRLSRSLRKRRLTALSGLIFSPLIYAKVHNEGLRAGRGKGFKMPKRQFVGNSNSLNKKIRLRLEGRINQIFK